MRKKPCKGIRAGVFQDLAAIGGLKSRLPLAIISIPLAAFKFGRTFSRDSGQCAGPESVMLKPRRNFILKKLTCLFTLSCFISFPAMADYASNGAPFQTLSQALDASGISLTGYVDAAYSDINSTGLFVNSAAGPVVGGAAGNTHIFDAAGATQGRNYSAFNMQQFALTLARQPKEGFGGYVNMTAGQDAATIASMGFGAPGSVNDGSHNADLTQAYGSYAQGGLTVIAGKFATLAGEELITSPSNFNYTHSWMFGWGPYTHTGVRATYAVNGMVTLVAGVNNGFDQVSSGTGGKTGEFAIDVAPDSMFSLNTSYYRGKGMMSAMPGTGSYLDMIGTVNATSRLTLVADYANARQDDALLTGSGTLQGSNILNGQILPANTTVNAKWHALALYANYRIDDQWRVAYRNENFDDPQGFRSGISQRLMSNTLTLGFVPVRNTELRAEIRQDRSSGDYFLNADGAGKSTQMTYAMEALYQF